jgi:hypothetical protein
MSNTNWSGNEVDLIIESYFNMLKLEIIGTVYNKAFYRRELLALLNNRSDASIEFKYQNISAILIQLGLPYINGYKPRYNYQNILFEKITSYLNEQPHQFLKDFELFATDASTIPGKIDFEKILSSPPPINVKREVNLRDNHVPFKLNYIEQEQRNTSLGLKGEKLILEYEQWRLRGTSLPIKIQWISERDDSAGFDILSKNEDGSERYIEVKTTKLGKESPFYFSSTEYEFSKKMSMNYYLYRLYNFSVSPKLFISKGDFDSFCQKKATKYKGFF